MKYFERSILTAVLNANEKIKGNPNHYFPVKIYDEDDPDTSYEVFDFYRELSKRTGFSLELDEQTFDLYSPKTEQDPQAIVAALNKIFNEVVNPYHFIVRFSHSMDGSFDMNVMPDMGLDNDDFDVLGI